MHCHVFIVFIEHLNRYYQQKSNYLAIFFVAVEVLHGHRDYTQVVMDVNRSLKRFPPGIHIALRNILRRKKPSFYNKFEV